MNDNNNTGNPNRKGYGFVTNFKNSLDLILHTNNNKTNFPSFNFVYNSSETYKLEIINDRKVPYYGIKIEEVTSISNNTNLKLEFNRGIDYKVEKSSTNDERKLFIGDNNNGNTINQWILLEDTNNGTDESYTFQINNEISNTLDLKSTYDVDNFFTEFNNFISLTNISETNKIEDDDGDLDFILDSEGKRTQIYLPFIVPISRRQYQSNTTSNIHTLSNYGNKFKIYNNKFYKTFTDGGFTVKKCLKLII